jgi:transcriptional regulator with XRE-family HTH domain
MQLARLKEWRESRGLTQRELAAEAAVGHVTVARIETGASVTPPTARKIAETLGLSVADLMERPPVPLGEVGDGVPNSIEELLERHHTETRHLADPNLWATLGDDSRPLEDVVRVVREATEELEAIVPDVMRLSQLRSYPRAMWLCNEVSRQIALVRLALPARRGQKFMPIQLEASADKASPEALPELTPEQRAEINEAMRKLAEAGRPLEEMRA